MLAQTVRDNLNDINNLKMRTKTAKFSTLFSTAPTIELEKQKIRQVLMKDGLVTVDDDSLLDEIAEEETMINTVEISVEDENIEDYIVENPNELVVQFPVASSISVDEGLPFFKSLSLKLANI